MTGISAVAGPARPVVLALGSNMGDRLRHLQDGLNSLCGGAGSAGGGALACRAVSAVFQTAPVGGPDQDHFLNAVVVAHSDLDAHAILDRCRQAENAAGRVRTVHWGPRTLDVDIITCGTEVRSDPDLTLPHPRAHERAFVLMPWLDVQPDAVLPGRGPVAALLDAVTTKGVSRIQGLSLVIPAPAREDELCR